MAKTHRSTVIRRLPFAIGLVAAVVLGALTFNIVEPDRPSMWHATTVTVLIRGTKRVSEVNSSQTPSKVRFTDYYSTVKTRSGEAVEWDSPRVFPAWVNRSGTIRPGSWYTPRNNADIQLMVGMIGVLLGGFIGYVLTFAVLGLIFGEDNNEELNEQAPEASSISTS